jgi:Cof subfamily protein (haloacid dehalogenase superfamily)
VNTTLYVCDLDGTLLGGDARLSDFARETVNSLIDSGARITIATARSLISLRRVAGDLDLREPLVVYGGAFIVDPQSGEHLVENVLSPGLVERLIESCERLRIQPLVYSLDADSDTVSWASGDESPGIRWYLGDRAGDPRFRPVPGSDALPRGGVFSLAVIGEELELAAAGRILVAGFEGEITVTLQEETYEAGTFWLEIAAPASTKGHAVDALRSLTGAERVVCFGDNRNDLAMFRVADEAYAVENALPEVREAATAVIRSNVDDGVAHWLAAHAAG